MSLQLQNGWDTLGYLKVYIKVIESFPIYPISLFPLSQELEF